MEAMRVGEGLFNALVHLAASMATMYLNILNGVESLCSFVLSDDFTTGYLLIQLINFILGRQDKDTMSIDLKNQIAPLERSLDEELEGGREEDRCKLPTRVAANKTRTMTCTTIDVAMVSASGQCSICLQEFEEGQPGKLMPECHHLFHPVCIDIWLITHSSCPLCRSHVDTVGNG